VTPQLQPDALLITHSHGDHYDLSTLLRFGAQVRIIVPFVERESLLAIDMVYRLRELGFERVTALAWNQETTVGDFRIVALPFYGEQPTTDEVYHPEVRNTGNVYLVEGEGRRYVFTADAGRDGAGDVRQVARAAASRYGAADVVFGGFRSWSLYPAQYLNVEFARYLLFVPPWAYGVRQAIMNDADALLDTAERWQARQVVPYANGGAPWYHACGLGPAPERIDQTDEHFDPCPEMVVRAARRRTSVDGQAIESGVPVVLLRPGESLELSGPAAEVVSHAGHVWPYPRHELAATKPAPRGGRAEAEPTTARRRALLRLLARGEAERLALEVTRAEVQAESNAARLRLSLERREDMLAWLAQHGLDIASFSELVTEYATIARLERHYASELDEQLGVELAFGAAPPAQEPPDGR
jgi:L-ascorbate metabolism protein UlaG (beta-lactamase superfamily)